VSCNIGNVVQKQLPLQVGLKGWMRPKSVSRFRTLRLQASRTKANGRLTWSQSYNLRTLVGSKPRAFDVSYPRWLLGTLTPTLTKSYVCPNAHTVTGEHQHGSSVSSVANAESPMYLGWTVPSTVGGWCVKMTTRLPGSVLRMSWTVVFRSSRCRYLYSVGSKEWMHWKLFEHQERISRQSGSSADRRVQPKMVTYRVWFM
jgi:hypothetical protein